MPGQRLRFAATPDRRARIGRDGEPERRRWHHDPESELGQRLTKQRNRRIHLDFRVGGVADGSHPGTLFRVNLCGCSMNLIGMDCKGGAVGESSVPEFCIGELAMARRRRFLARA